VKRAILAGALLLFAGCSEAQINHAGDAVASAAPQIASDGLLIAKVESRLVQIDPASALHVAVSSHDGAVKLSGKVKSSAISQKYAAAAKAISGVKSVDVALSIDSSIPNAQQQVGDFSLTTAVRANLAGQAGLNGLSIGVKAHDGVVTLSGHVKTAALKSTLAGAAKSTSGVKSVVDQLTVAE
jgi:osmotically-inducible protein OsmY